MNVNLVDTWKQLHLSASLLSKYQQIKKPVSDVKQHPIFLGEDLQARRPAMGSKPSPNFPLSFQLFCLWISSFQYFDTFTKSIHLYSCCSTGTEEHLLNIRVSVHEIRKDALCSICSCLKEVHRDLLAGGTTPRNLEGAVQDWTGCTRVNWAKTKLAWPIE